MKKKSRKELNDVIDINGSKVFVEDGEVKTIFSESIQKSGYMDVEDLREIIKAEVSIIYNETRIKKIASN